MTAERSDKEPAVPSADVSKLPEMNIDEAMLEANRSVVARRLLKAIGNEMDCYVWMAADNLEIIARCDSDWHGALHLYREKATKARAAAQKAATTPAEADPGWRWLDAIDKIEEALKALSEMKAVNLGRQDRDAST